MSPPPLFRRPFQQRANLDPEASRGIREFILRLKNEGKTVFLNTHNLFEAQRVCDRVGIMQGKLLAAGAPSELRRSLWPARTAIQVAGPIELAIAAAKGAGPWTVIRDEHDGGMLIEVDDPLEDNPKVVKALVESGIRILFVTEVSPTLEDVYMGMVKKN